MLNNTTSPSTFSGLKWALILLGWGLVLYAIGWFLSIYNQVVGHFPN